MHNPKLLKIRQNYLEPLQKIANYSNQRENNSVYQTNIRIPPLPSQSSQLLKLMQKSPTAKKPRRIVNVPLKKRQEFVKLNLLKLSQGFFNSESEDNFKQLNGSQLIRSKQIDSLSIHNPLINKPFKFKSRLSLHTNDKYSQNDSSKLFVQSYSMDFKRKSILHQSESNDSPDNSPNHDLNHTETENFRYFQVRNKPKKPLRKVIYLNSKSRNEVQDNDKYSSIQETLRETIEDFGISDYIKNLQPKN